MPKDCGYDLLSLSEASKFSQTQLLWIVYLPPVPTGWSSIWNPPLQSLLMGGFVIRIHASCQWPPVISSDLWNLENWLLFRCFPGANMTCPNFQASCVLTSLPICHTQYPCCCCTAERYCPFATLAALQRDKASDRRPSSRVGGGY